MSDVANPTSRAPKTSELTITQVGRDRLDLIRAINETVFDTDHVIRTFDRDDLLMLVAWMEEEPVGFKVGYPNKHPGMTVMGLDEGFEVVRAGWSPQYEDYRLRFELEL